MEAAAVPRQAPGAGRLGASPAILRFASDPHLVALIRAGRPAAFEVAYDRHHRAILAFCRHLLGDRDEAEDAAQHTFLSAYKGLIASNQPIQLRPWLFTIARNRCFSILRARREVAVAELEPGVSEEPAALLERREDLRDLVLDLTRLPDDQRAALVMAELEALSHDEIAAVLDVPREKVKALVFQARESLSATRAARETDCAEIRRQLRTVRGPALRRGHLRRHLHECPGCQEYRRQLRHQRARAAAFLPLLPPVLRPGSLFRALTGTRTARAASGGGAGGGTVVASSALKLGLIKPVFGAVVAAMSAAGAAVVVHTVDGRHVHRARPRTTVAAASTTPDFIHRHTGPHAGGRIRIASAAMPTAAAAKPHPDRRAAAGQHATAAHQSATAAHQSATAAHQSATGSPAARVHWSSTHRHGPAVQGHQRVKTASPSSGGRRGAPPAPPSTPPPAPTSGPIIMAGRYLPAIPSAPPSTNTKSRGAQSPKPAKPPKDKPAKPPKDKPSGPPNSESPAHGHHPAGGPPSEPSIPSTGKKGAGSPGNHGVGNSSPNEVGQVLAVYKSASVASQKGNKSASGSKSAGSAGAPSTAGSKPEGPTASAAGPVAAAKSTKTPGSAAKATGKAAKN